MYIEQATTFDEARRPTSARILCNLRCIGPRRRVAHFTFRAYLATKHGPPTVRTSFPILIPFAKFLSKYRNSDAFLHFLHDKISFCRQFYPFTGKIIVANFYIVKFFSKEKKDTALPFTGFLVVGMKPGSLLFIRQDFSSTWTKDRGFKKFLITVD